MPLPHVDSEKAAGHGEIKREAWYSGRRGGETMGEAWHRPGPDAAIGFLGSMSLRVAGLESRGLEGF